IDLLKDVQEQISQLKTMAVQMNSQIHQLDPHSNKVKDLIEMLQKLTGKHDEIEYALRDYYQMIKDLPVRNE
ncbi:MAG TPA: hypothetical protein VI958_10760, partial [Acidobacteriota bacterium]